MSDVTTLIVATLTAITGLSMAIIAYFLRSLHLRFETHLQDAAEAQRRVEIDVATLQAEHSGLVLGMDRVEAAILHLEEKVDRALAKP